MIELEPKEPEIITEELEKRPVRPLQERANPIALAEGESTTESSDVIEPVTDNELPSAEKAFDIEKYPDWRSIWETYAEQDRHLLTEMIEVGNITPEIYQNLNISVVHMGQDKKLSQIDPGYGEGNAAAEVSYASRQVRLFPEFYTRTERQQRHIHGHELGHFLSTHYINPSEIAPLLNKQPSWSNGKYIQKIGRDLPHRFVIEAAADYAADFLHSRSGEEMLQRRLMRAGSKEEFESRGEEEIKQLIAENEEIFAFFKSRLSADRQDDESTQLAMTQQWEWLRMLATLEETELEETDYIEPISPEVADDLWQPPAANGKELKRNWIKWLVTSGLEG